MEHILCKRAPLITQATAHEPPAQLAFLHLAGGHSIADLHDFAHEVAAKDGTGFRKALEMLLGVER